MVRKAIVDFALEETGTLLDDGNSPVGVFLAVGRDFFGH